MNLSASFLAALLAAAPNDSIPDDSISVSARLETDVLHVGEEYEIVLQLDLGPDGSAGRAGIPAPILQLEVPPSVELLGRRLTTYRELAKNEFLQEPYERLLKELPAQIRIRLKAQPDPQERIALNLVGYVSTTVDGERRDFFLRRRLEMKVEPNARGKAVEPTNSSWGTHRELLQIGREAEPFVLPRADGTEFDLASVLGTKNVIVTTYRAHW